MSRDSKPTWLAPLGGIALAISAFLAFVAKHSEGWEHAFYRVGAAKAAVLAVRPTSGVSQSYRSVPAGATDGKGIAGDTLLRGPDTIPFKDGTDPCLTLEPGSVESLVCEAKK